jgi:two-component system chemotaxis sensor kinase CheA
MKEMLNPYCDEIRKNVDVLEEYLIALKSDTDDRSILVTILHILKIINGNSDLQKYDKISRISGGLISLIEELIEGQTTINKNILNILSLSISYYGKLLEDVESGEEHITIEHLLHALKNSTSSRQLDITDIFQKDILKQKISIAMLQNQSKLNNSKKVEVSLKKVDNAINKLNDIVLNQYQLKTSIEKINNTETRLLHFMDAIDEIIDNKQNADRLKKEINQITDELKKIDTELGNKISHSERDTFTLQEDILSFRMVSVSLIHPELKAAVTSVIKKSGKKIRLSFTGASPLIDKYILQKLIRPLENIIQNSVEHGIEPETERAKLGKPTTAHISIHYRESGGKITFSISDDGRGINFIQLRKICMNVFEYESEEIEKMQNEELLKYLFINGISLRDESGFVSGSGNGLFEAYEGVQQVKGKINVRIIENGGFEVTLIVPKSLTTVNGFFVKSAGEKFLIPSTFIEEILYVDAEDVIDLLTKHAIKLRNDIITIYPLAGILKSTPLKEENKLHVIIGLTP